MSDRYKIVLENSKNPFVESQDQKGRGKDGQVKKGSFFGRSIKIREHQLNRGSLIDFINTQAEKPVLSKGRFFGLIGGASDSEIQKAFEMLIIKSQLNLIKKNSVYDKPADDLPSSEVKNENVSEITPRDEIVPNVEEQINPKEKLAKIDTNHPEKAVGEIRQLLKEHPELINEKINFGVFESVYLSHLLCAGRLGTLEQTLETLDHVIGSMDLFAIDTSNLWGEVGMFGGSGSGNNVLKSAVASASTLPPFSKAENRAIVEKLLNKLDQLDEDLSKKLLNSLDNFPFGSHTIVEFLLRQGHDDLALKALRLGGEIREDSFWIAMASTTTTAHGLELSQQIVENYIQQDKKLSPLEHWRAKVALLKVPFDYDEAVKQNLVGLAGCKGSDEMPEVTLRYWLGNGRGTNLLNNVYGEVDVFGSFTDHYRKDSLKSIVEHHTEFFNDAKNVEAFKQLQESFKQIKVDASYDEILAKIKGLDASSANETISDILKLIKEGKKDPHEILGLEMNATADEINKQYLALCAKLHPDRCNDPLASECFKLVGTAYDLIRN